MMIAGGVRIRGLQPFHDFAEGPDWWDLDQYKLLLDQMAKLKMNFIGLHTYGGDLAEPTVWTGRPANFNPNTGQIYPNGSYPSAYMSTAAGAVWGGEKMNISEYLFGSQNAFASECFSSAAMRAAGDCPDSLRNTTEPQVPLMDGVAALLKDAFAWGRELGLKSCVGTEVGEAVPPQERAHPAALKEYYKGALQRIEATYRADYYWIWTPEGWPARNNASMELSDPSVVASINDFMALNQAKRELNSTISLATSGWTLGPRRDRSYFDKILPPEWALSSINEKVGNANVELEYRDVRPERETWSIPWLEDDPGLLQTLVASYSSCVHFNSTVGLS